MTSDVLLSFFGRKHSLAGEKHKTDVFVLCLKTAPPS